MVKPAERLSGGGGLLHRNREVMAIEIVSFPIYQWWLSIAMLVYQRICFLHLGYMLQNGEFNVELLWNNMICSCGWKVLQHLQPHLDPHRTSRGPTRSWSACSAKQRLGFCDFSGRGWCHSHMPWCSMMLHGAGKLTYICVMRPHVTWAHVGKYSSTMEHMGFAFELLMSMIVGKQELSASLTVCGQLKDLMCSLFW